MPYLVKEIFYTLQGEGFWTGRPAVFCRFARCNLWTGREEDRGRATCQFCDTDFLHGDRYDEDDLLDRINWAWPAGRPNKMVVFTGGEPAIQLNAKFVNAVKQLGFYTAVETNGTMPIPNQLDWVCVSPKAGTNLVTRVGDELKVVFPQPDLKMDWLANRSFDHFWISPMDGPDLEINTRSAVEYVMNNPQWRLNVQTHKMIGVR